MIINMKLPEAFTGTKDNINAIVETPKHSRSKYVYNPNVDLFEFKKACPPGLTFPLDFGFIPGTLAEDGDPMDVLIFTEEPSFPGCLFECRVIGIIEAQQEKEGKMTRNDRVLACPIEADQFIEVKSIDDIDKLLLDNLVRFFKFYHKQENEKFELLKMGDAGRAIKQIKKHIHFAVI
jgi:inorganic pyrophosphatase